MQLALLLCTAIYWGQNLRIIFENNPELQVIGHENLRPVGYNKWTSYNQGADGDKMSTYHAITIEVNDERLSDLLVQIHSFNTGLVLGKEKVEFLLVISQMIFGNSLLLLELCAQNKLPMPLLNVDLNQNGLHPTPGAIGDLSETLLQMLGINTNAYKSYHPPTTGSVFTVHPPPSETPGFMQWINIIKSIKPQPLLHTVPHHPHFHIRPPQTPPTDFDIPLSQPQHSQFIIPQPTPRKPHFQIPRSLPWQPHFEIPLPPPHDPRFIVPHPPLRKPYLYLPFPPPPQPPKFITLHPPPKRPQFDIPLTPQPHYKILRPISRPVPPMVYLPPPQMHLPRPKPSSIYSLPIQRPHPQFQMPEIPELQPSIHYTRPIPQTQSTAVNISKKVTWPHPWLSPPQAFIEHRPLPQIIYKPHRITPRPVPQIWPQFIPAPEPVDIPNPVSQWHKKVIFESSTPRPQLVLSTPYPTPVYVPQPQKHVSISVSTVKPSYQIPQWPDLQNPQTKKSINYITTTRPPVLHRHVITTHQRPPLRPVQWVELPKPFIHVTPRPVIQSHVTLIPTPRPQYTPWPVFQPARTWQQPLQKSVQITVARRPTPLHSHPQQQIHISTPQPTPQPGPNSIHITTVQPLPDPQPILIPHREHVPVQHWEPIPMPIPIPRPITHFIPEFIPKSIPRPLPQSFILPRPIPMPQVQWPQVPQTNINIKKIVNQPDPMLWPIPQPQLKKLFGVGPEINFTPRPIPQSVREIFITTQRPLPKMTLPMPSPRPLPHIQVPQWQPDVEIIKNEMHLPSIPQSMTIDHNIPTLHPMPIHSSTQSPTVIVTSKPRPIYFPELRPNNEISIDIQKTKPYPTPFTQPQPVWIPHHEELPISEPNPVYYPKPMPTKEITTASATVTPVPHPQPKVTILTTPEPQPSYREVTQIYASRTEPVHISPEPHWPIPSASPSTIIIPNNAYPTPPTFVPDVPESEVMVSTTQAPQTLGGDLINHPPQPDDLDNFTVVPTTEIYASLTVTTGTPVTPDKEEHNTIHGEDCAHTQHRDSPKYIIIQDNKFKLNPVLVSEDLFYYIIENTDNLNPLKYYTPVTYPVNVAPGVTKLKTLVYYILPLQIKDLQQPGTLKIQNFLYIPTNLQSDHFGIEKGDILAPLSNKVDIEKVLHDLVKVVNHKQWITTPSNNILQHWITGNNGEIGIGLNIFGSAPGFGRGDNHGGEFTIGGIDTGHVQINHPNTLEGVITSGPGGNNLGGIQLGSGGIGTGTSEIGFGMPLGTEGIVSGPGRIVSGPGGFVSGPGGFVSGPERIISGPGVIISGPGGFVSGPGGIVSGPGGFVSGPGGIVSGSGVELGENGLGGGIETGPYVFGSEEGIGSGPVEFGISGGVGSGPGRIKFGGDLPSGQRGNVSEPGFELGTGGGFGGDLQFGKGGIVSGPGFEFGKSGGFDVTGGGFVGTGGGFGGFFSGPGGQGTDLGTEGSGFGLGGGIALGSDGIQWGSGGAGTGPAIETGINNIFGQGFGSASSGNKPSKYWISPDILKSHSEIRPPSTLDVQLPKITIPNDKKALNLVELLLRKKQDAASITANNVATGGGFWKFNPLSSGADGSQNERDSLQFQQVNAGVPQTVSQASDVTQMSNGLSGMSANVQNDAPVTTYSPSEPSMDEHQQSVTESSANDQKSQSDAPNAADSASDAPQPSRTVTEPSVSDDLLG